MQVSKDGIEGIKAANPLADVVAERGIELKRKGRVLVGRCPYHSPDKTPSFSVTPSKGLFHCFGCGAAGDVIGFVTKHDKVSFGKALEILAKRAGLDLKALMADRPRIVRAAPAEALAPSVSTGGIGNDHDPAALGPLLARVVEHYHRTFLEREDAQAYLVKQRGLADLDLLRAHKVGYADGSLLKLIPKSGELHGHALAAGVITPEGRELLGGCIVVPIPDPLTGQWANLYGRGMKTPRHCYLPGPLRGVLNFQAARVSPEVILTESILDALSFHQVGIATVIPLFGTNGLTPDHLDLLKRERVTRVILALDNDDAGRKATASIKEKLTAAGIAVRVASFPSGIKDANELLVSRNGDAGPAFRAILVAAEPRPPSAPAPAPASSPLTEKPSTPGGLTLSRDGLSYTARAYPAQLGRLRATVKVERDSLFHVDTIDLYASRSRAEFARRAAKVFSVESSAVDAALLALLVEAEKAADEEKPAETPPGPPPMSEVERAEAMGFLLRADMLDQVVRDAWALGVVGEAINIKILFLIAISRLQDDPLSAIVLSQSGAGKSGLAELMELLCPPEGVVLFTRLTAQSLYYTAPGYLDHKLVLVEERYGSVDADYPIRVLQSRKKLSVLVPIKDPATGNMRTRTFEVKARAAFIEATTAGSVNHENATRCFELSMDESVEQTARIHVRQRLMRTEAGLKLRQEAEAITRRHWNAQRLLETLPVVIPFADKLSFPTAWMRTRRDHARFLNLIEASAFLHQYQRERRGGAIVASLADYAVAYELAGAVLAETLSDLRKPLREAYTRIRALCLAGDGTVSRREIREALAVPDSTVRGWLQSLVELEYVEAEASKGGAGRSTRYRLVDRGPRQDLLLGLLTPEDLKRLLERP
jgi:DNA primase catalytic core